MGPCRRTEFDNNNNVMFYKTLKLKAILMRKQMQVMELNHPRMYLNWKQPRYILLSPSPTYRLRSAVKTLGLGHFTAGFDYLSRCTQEIKIRIYLKM